MERTKAAYAAAMKGTCKFVRKYIGSSGAQELFLSDVTTPSVQVPSLNLKSAGLANAYMDSQKLDAILCMPCSYYSFASVLK